MSLNLPKNKAGGTANPDNEAHMLAVTKKGIHAVCLYIQSEPDKSKRLVAIEKYQELIIPQARATEAADKGDFAWRKAVEAEGKEILDYWDGKQVFWPLVLDHENKSSKLSFLMYLARAVNDLNVTVLMDELAKAEREILIDDFWIINSIDDVVI